MIIGLTGGIGSGKSTVSRQLSARGALVLDADAVAHELMARGQPVWRDVWEAFGWPVLDAAGHLNRARLGRLVFHSVSAREALNRLVHPAVRDALRCRTRTAAGAPWIVWDVPLLIEGGLFREVDQVWVVYATRAQQIERIAERSQCTREEAAARVKAQWPLEQKLAYADRVLDNTGTLEALAQQIQAATAGWATS